MPSPFPGMNPYLENPDVWADFHDLLIAELRVRLLSALRPRYYVSMQRNVYIHELPEEPVRRLGKSDVTITGLQTSNPAATTATLEAPARIRILNPIEEERISYLAITDRKSNQVVTVIEILSPSNKANGSDRDQYLAKRRAVLESSANLVEIDLLRGGPRLPAEAFPDCDYAVIVSRPAVRPEAAIWPISLRDPLPTIPIPLSAGDSETLVDLQDLLNHVYDAGSFDLVACKSPPEPALSASDKTWAEGLLISIGRQ